ncbi:hypothetical protein [Psychrobacter sp.]|uniref:hypothetical protein n=1 Tax=Psychrobacter sp. TaxID=56811 RepID=UPI0025D8D365|nr:hypothetical protein [Psychrobacter sp.]
MFNSQNAVPEVNNLHGQPNNKDDDENKDHNGLKNLNGDSLQNQVKRQKEWVYLSHFLAIQGLQPVHIISGKDDGNEPDFTLVFWEDNQLVYIGIELTTLPRLRSQMSDSGLIAKRWYWQALNIVAKQNLENHVYDHENGYLTAERFKIPMKTAYMPRNKFIKQRKGRSISIITQKDVDEVMKKKQPKIESYHIRRPLNELWLLIHTDKYQPETILSFERSKQTGNEMALKHDTAFDNVQITCYPSYRILNVLKV